MKILKEIPLGSNGRYTYIKDYIFDKNGVVLYAKHQEYSSVKKEIEDELKQNLLWR